jgi:hypothetical protein
MNAICTERDVSFDIWNWHIEQGADEPAEADINEHK